MKRKIFFILASVLMISSIHAYGQALITKSDSISLANDSIVRLALPQYRGNVQWQKSPDGINWNALEVNHSDTLKVKPSVEALYRAAIKEGTCLPVYSDTVGIISNDTIVSNYIIPSNSGAVLISDSVDLSVGRYIYVGSSDESLFETGKVIIDTTSRVIRKVTDVIQKDDTIITLTGQATLEDIFQEASFKLSTSMYQPAQNLKSASPEDITRSLTDEEGFIHPVSVTFRDEEGKVLKKASIFDQNAAESDNALYLHFDLNHVLWDFTGTGILPDKNGNFVTLSGTSKCYFSDSNITLDPEFKFEFDFKRPKFSWDELKFSKGELTLFKFYSDESIFDIKMVLARESDISFTVGKSCSLLPEKVPLLCITRLARFPFGWIMNWTCC